MGGNKTCSKCGAEKSVDGFYKRGSSCKDCVKAKSAAYYWSNREKALESVRNWAKNNPEKKLANNVRWNKKNAPAIARNSAAWKSRNPGVAGRGFARWQKANPHICNAIKARRRAAKLSATPLWADEGSIKFIYAESARMTVETGIAYSVDHIVPLQSELVCGLHWEGNLQIITRSENSAKRNHYWPDMP